MNHTVLFSVVLQTRRLEHVRVWWAQPSGLQSFSVKSEDSPLPNLIEYNHNSYFWLNWQSSAFGSGKSCPGTYADDGMHNPIVHKRTIKYTINFSSVSGSSFPNYFFVSFCSSFFPRSVFQPRPPAPSPPPPHLLFLMPPSFLRFPLFCPNPLFWPSGQIFSSISPQCEVTPSAPITILVTEINNLVAVQLELK